MVLSIKIALSLSLAAIGTAQGPPTNAPKPQGDPWIEASRQTLAGTHYEFFATPSRGKATQASYLIYLPPDYASAPTRRYPVLYWLHGGGGNQLEGTWLVERLDAEMRQGNIPPFLVVLVQGLPDVRYINSKYGTCHVEEVVMKDLLPHVDSTYRTLTSRQSRAIEGMSMGGFGALRLGFKYPERFGIVSAVAPSITAMKDEPDFVTEPFGHDKDFYDAVGPWTIVRQDAAEIRKGMTVRLLVGGKDKLLPLVQKYSQLLTTLKIKHQFAIAPNATHQYRQVIEGLPFNA
jgi:enterochelin esterase-like enzyme